MANNNDYNHLVSFIVAINAPGLSKASILELICTFWHAEDCIWYRSKRKEDIIMLNHIDANSVKNGIEIKLDTPSAGEKLLIINSSVDDSLKEDMKLMTKAILSNISTYDYEYSHLERQLYLDALTGIANNEALINKINGKKAFSNVGVAFVDVNALGIVNNTLGHEAGDLMLKTIASIIASKVRENEAYRKGGDEFVVICEGISEEIFKLRMDEAKKEIEEHGYSISAGVVHSPYCLDIEALIEQADSKMYEEKVIYRENNPSKYSVNR